MVNHKSFSIKFLDSIGFLIKVESFIKKFAKPLRVTAVAHHSTWLAQVYRWFSVYLRGNSPSMEFLTMFVFNLSYQSPSK